MTSTEFKKLACKHLAIFENMCFNYKVQPEGLETGGGKMPKNYEFLRPGQQVWVPEGLGREPNDPLRNSARLKLERISFVGAGIVVLEGRGRQIETSAGGEVVPYKQSVNVCVDFFLRWGPGPYTPESLRKGRKGFTT